MLDPHRDPKQIMNYATGILLDDRVINNDQLKTFFLEIPKRLTEVEKADDTVSNLDVAKLSSDVTNNKSDLSQLKSQYGFLASDVSILQRIIGGQITNKTVQLRLQELEEATFGVGEEDGLKHDFALMSSYIDEIQDPKIEDLEKAVDEFRSTVGDLKERDVTFENKLNDFDSKLAQVDVNNATITLLQTQLNQLRTECMNGIANCQNSIEALDENITLLRNKINSYHPSN